MITVRPATAADLAEIHPEAVGTSYRAWACELDGETVGAIGLALTRPRACLFCGFTEALRPHLKSMTVLRLLKRVERVIRERNLPVYAIRDLNEPKAPEILGRLGFAYYAKIDGEPVWKWTPR
jgi:hypothetical protein